MQRAGADGMAVTKHITVCICTYKRPDLLKRLLHELGQQETDGLFTFDVVVVDNDASESAQPVTAEFATGSKTPIRYFVESRQSIAMTRNKAVENAKGDFVAFIDDDEFPIRNWLLILFNALHQYQVDGVLGPVKPHFDGHPPAWLVKGNFHDRETYPTGMVIDWRKGRTGNVLLKASLFAGSAEPFDPTFRTGEDQVFFQRMIEKGHVFIWCDEAVAYEVVPPVRWTRSFLLRRALLRGALEPLTPNFGARDVAKSLVAVPAYAMALPFALILGPDKLMNILVRMFHHGGKLLALVGINPIREQYVIE